VQVCSWELHQTRTKKAADPIRRRLLTKSALPSVPIDMQPANERRLQPSLAERGASERRIRRFKVGQVSAAEAVTELIAAGVCVVIAHSLLGCAMRVYDAIQILEHACVCL
jgi:hypothetical protein